MIKIVIIGAGNVASHLFHAFDSLGQYLSSSNVQ